MTVTDLLPCDVVGPTDSCAATVDPASPTVVIVDDHRLLAQSLHLSLQMEGVTSRVLVLREPEALLDELLALRPELVLLDLDLGPVGDGAELVAPLVRNGSRVVIVSASDAAEHKARALENGALGILSKDVDFFELLDSILAAVSGEEVMDPRERMRLLNDARLRRDQRAQELAPFHALSARESQVLHGLAEGRNAAAIARRAFVSEATVRSQIRAILNKLCVRSQLEAVAKAHEVGWS